MCVLLDVMLLGRSRRTTIPKDTPRHATPPHVTAALGSDYRTTTKNPSWRGIPIHTVVKVVGGWWQCQTTATTTRIVGGSRRCVVCVVRVQQFCLVSRPLVLEWVVWKELQHQPRVVFVGAVGTAVAVAVGNVAFVV